MCREVGGRTRSLFSEQMIHRSWGATLVRRLNRIAVNKRYPQSILGSKRFLSTNAAASDAKSNSSLGVSRVAYDEQDEYEVDFKLLKVFLS